MSNDKEKVAAAIKYDSDKNNAPEVVAIGQKHTADKIIQTAKQSGVPIYENEPLAKSLSNLPVGQEIPKELYDIVAQILIFVAELDEVAPRKYV